MGKKGRSYGLVAQAFSVSFVLFFFGGGGRGEKRAERKETRKGDVVRAHRRNKKYSRIDDMRERERKSITHATAPGLALACP